ncbi:ROK family protein [Clostridium sp. AM58-1XD]|uniref:ROK family protein n=1 Tax=Clostridium sp. AM58-1XD TaxID=2292307 RepID=UPI000E4D3438|nr:ROK family protein [Clostridium sp. AM58-1XD]RGY97485.1 ROK family transcriptional regulator [Clostridium sp. AM58-1XD]
MYPKGLNLENVKITNRSCVLRLLFSDTPLSRTTISDRLSLTQATVTTICNDFLRQGLILQQESVASSSKVGRKRSPIAINYDYKLILAIDIHGSSITLSIVNLHGDVKAAESFLLPPQEPKDFFRAIAQRCIHLLWINNISPSDILGAGVTTLGPVNHVDGVSLHSFTLFDTPVPFKELLEKELPFPVFVESNVCAYLRAELLYCDSSSFRNALILKWGPGVGSASVIDGALFKGHNYRSSELGHNYVDSQYGIRCKCGHVGCLETKISLECIINLILYLTSKGNSSLLKEAAAKYGAPSKDNILHYLKVQDPTLQSYLRESCHALAVATNNAIQILAPDRIILYGDIFESDEIIQLFKEEIQGINPEIESALFAKSPLNSERLYIGAAAVVIEELLIKSGGS